MKKSQDLIENIVKYLNVNAVKAYLILANVILVIFAIWFSNVGVLPFKNVGDFTAFVVLFLILAVYRPGWTFVFFIGAIALENINLAPKNFGLALRPYQFFSAITIIALFVQIATKRLPFALPKFKWHDALPIVFALGGFLSAIFSANRGVSFKQSLIALSFIALYFLVRVYVQSLEDLKRIAPFFFSSAVVVLIYGIWQNVRFNFGASSFEIMPGRPNATFTEPDWLGIYLIFLLSVLLTIIYCESKKTGITNFKIQIFPPRVDERTSPRVEAGKQITNFKLQIAKNITLVTLTLLVLILTVSRSAWLGAAFVLIGFLKIMLTNGSLRISEWDWKKFFHVLQFVIMSIICSIAVVYIFGLTRFQIFNRAVSTGGLQKITIACFAPTEFDSDSESNSDFVNNVGELEKYGCRQINLEDIEKEKALGNEIQEVYRPDPNVNIRSGIYQKSIEQIKSHPIFGIGWGSIGKILGSDERGSSLNASNIFLEVWLGAGIIGLLSFIILLGYIFVKGAIMFLDRKIEDKTVAAFVMLGWAAIMIPNLFNSGIFLGFVWVYLAVAVSLVSNKKSNL